MDIKEALGFIMNDNPDRTIIANKLGVSKGMISHYGNGDNIPRLDVAAKVWGEYNLIIEPYTEKAIIAKWTELTKAK